MPRSQSEIYQKILENPMQFMGDAIAAQPGTPDQQEERRAFAGKLESLFSGAAPYTPDTLAALLAEGERLAEVGEALAAFIGLLREMVEEPPFEADPAGVYHDKDQPVTFAAFFDAAGRRKVDRIQKEELAQMDRESEAQKQRLEDVYIQAKNRSGYSKFELGAAVEKKALQDLCDEYKARVGADEALARILALVEKYAALDAHGYKNYDKEVRLVRTIQAELDRYSDNLDAQQEELMEKFRDPDAEELDLTVREERLDNRVRIHASLSTYFETLTPGNLRPKMDDLEVNGSEEEKQALALAKGKPYGRFENADFAYINGTNVHVEMDRDASRGSLGYKIGVGIADFLSAEANVKDMPIFPHEPRLNDIQQLLLGDCYALAGLQDVARLYPQKIKDMIRDNGDGTATVRFYEKRDGEFKPLYVQVDKRKAMSFGNWEAGGGNCLWASLIERAYMISGLHVAKMEGLQRGVPDEKVLKDVYEQYRKKQPLTPEDVQYLRENYPWLVKMNKDKAELKPWKPSLGAIEGGEESSFLQDCFGSEFSPQTIYFKAHNTERMWSDEDDQLYRDHLTDYPDKDAAQRMDILSRIALKRPDATAEDFVESLRQSFIKNKKGTDEDFTENCKSAMEAVSELLERGWTAVPASYSTGNLTLELMEKKSKGEIDPKQYAVQVHILQNLKITMARVNSAFSSRAAIFDKMFWALDKGLPISASSAANAKDVPENHAYSVIGAYQTKDNPPKYFVRLRNPWGGREHTNGVEFKLDSKGNPIAKQVSSKEGVFDMELNTFLKNYNEVNASGSQELIAEPHRKNETFLFEEQEKTPLYTEGKVDQRMFVDYMKFSRDIYAALLDTKSAASFDTEFFTELFDASKEFCDAAALSRGENTARLTEALDKLYEKAQSYEGHLDDSPSRRQTRRAKVCETIRQLHAREPEQAGKELEREFAKKLIVRSNLNANRNDEPTEADIKSLTGNRAFRTIVNEMSLHKMVHADKKLLNQTITKFCQLTKGHGVDKNVTVDGRRALDFQKSI